VTNMSLSMSMSSRTFGNSHRYLSTLNSGGHRLSVHAGKKVGEAHRCLYILLNTLSIFTQDSPVRVAHRCLFDTRVINSSILETKSLSKGDVFAL
jgi:hypothetical protein